MRRKHKYLALVILLFLSIGFAILSSNLSIGSSIGISNASFDVHIEDAVIYQTNVSGVSNPVINSERDTVTLDVELDKPGDYVNVTFYVVNAGTIDAQLNEIISTTLTTEEQKYLSYSYQYLSSGTISTGDLLRVGQKKRVLVSYQYKYDVTDFIDIDSKSLSLSLKYIQPNSYDDKVWTYNFENTYQTFKAPHTGSYKIELWGAQGGYYNGTSKGGYTAGNINLTKNDTIYLYVGEFKYSRSNYETFNGGRSSNDGQPGGGATDIRLIANSSWKDAASLNSRIMVAAGGGASCGTDSNSGYGGGLLGGVSFIVGSENYASSSATQTQAGVTKHNCGTMYDSGFGVGGSCAGGGGGYWGGAGSAGLTYGGGSGGSSFISGHNGCVAIKAADDRSPRLGTNNAACDDGTTDITCSYHYSGYKFTNTVMIDGQGYKWTTERGSEVVGMPTHDGTGTMTGNSGNGYAKITYLG